VGIELFESKIEFSIEKLVMLRILEGTVWCLVCERRLWNESLLVEPLEEIINLWFKAAPLSPSGSLNNGEEGLENSLSWVFELLLSISFSSSFLFSFSLVVFSLIILKFY
jgi:hypothetical protein